MALSQVIQAVIRYGAHQTGARWAACCTPHCMQLSSIVVVTEGGSPELYCDSASKDYEQTVSKEAGGTVVAKKSRLHCRGCLRRPLGQLKLSEDWQETTEIGLSRERTKKWSQIQSQSEDCKEDNVYLMDIIKSKIEKKRDTWCLRPILLGARRNVYTMFLHKTLESPLSDKSCLAFFGVACLWERVVSMPQSV